MFEGTRYEEARRFAVPLHDAKWQEVDLASFQSESVKADALLEQCNEFYGMLASVYLRYPMKEGDGEILSRSWIRSYNRKLSKCGYRYGSMRFVIHSGKQDTFVRALRGWLEDLGEAALKMAETLREETEDFNIKYYQRELLEQADDLEDAAELLELAVADLRQNR